MAVERTGLEIAIIGMAGKFPGAQNTAEFWQNLVNGVESISFFTSEELLAEGLHPDLVRSPNYVPAKGIVEGVQYFDYSFFDYSSWEAGAMDPQLRLMHEVAWEALEDGAVNPETYPGSIGVYTGASPNLVWMSRFANRISLDSVAEQYQVGIINDRDFFSTRLAYKLNLRGPAYTIQTACSTSLVAVHLACQGLLSGDCDMALAGGTSILLPQKHGYLHQEGMILSPDGHCKAFDARANGTVGGDGVALVLLKRLEDALADRDHVYAIIKGTACNNDGARKVGYAAPSIEGQAEVIRAAHRMAEVEPESVSYIETHGTGTAVGDPIEVEGLRLAFESEHRAYCKIGSVKTNIGHLDATAGVAGLIKTALSLYHRQLPPSLNFQFPNPRIDFVNSPFVVNTELTEWKSANGNPLRAGVNSYGIGGTNAHIVLEESEAQEPSSSSRNWQLLCLSAKTQTALERGTARLAEYLHTHPDVNLADLAYTLHVGRREFPVRRMFLCRETEDAVRQLALESREVRGGVAKDEHRPITFMFSGQGSQYVNMGRELYDCEPVFKEEVDRCLAILRSCTDVDLQAIWYPEETLEGASRINETVITQPVIFIFEYALAKLLLHWGITPTAMIGHSIGEYVAACLAGVFSLEDALELVALRGRLMQSTARGSMLSVSLPEAEMIPHLTEGLSLAAVNSPTLCVVSGPDAEIEALAAKLSELGHESRKLHTSHAFHSAMMDPVLDEFAAELTQRRLNPPKVAYISNLSGTWIREEEATDPAYWVQHLRGCVRFADGIGTILQEQNAVVLELGPGRALTTFARQHPLRKREQLIVNLIRHPSEERSDHQFLLENLGQIWLSGVRVDWKRYYAAEVRNRLPLPTYAFDQHEFAIDVPDINNVQQFAGRSEVGAMPPREVAKPLIQRTDLPEDFLAPRNALEEQVAGIFGEVLGLDRVGVQEDFFELGGDSLQALVVTSKVKQKLGAEIAIAEFFKNPDIERLAKYLAATGSEEPNTASQDETEGASSRTAETEVSMHYAAIEPAEPQEYYPLSTAQKREFIVEQLANGSVVNNISQAVQIDGEIDPARFEVAIGQVIAAHESLRTGFGVQGLEPVQIISPQIDFHLEIIDAAGRTPESIIRDFVRPFDLSQPPLFRVGLARLAKDQHLLIIDMHHIIGDGTSTGIFVEQILRCYQGVGLPTMRLQYKDYAVWQKAVLASEALLQQKEYWLHKFADGNTRVNLPLDYARPAVKTSAGDYYTFVLEEPATTALLKMGQEEGVTLYMNLLAAYSVLLAKYSGQTEVAVGTAIAGRNHADLQAMIGMFVNLLVNRNRVDEAMSYQELLHAVKVNTLEAFDNQDFPFDQLVAELNLKRDRSRSPFYDVALNVQNFKQADVTLPNLQFKQIEYKNQTAQCDLTLNAWKLEKGLRFELIYSTGLFTRATITKMAEHFQEILHAVTTNKAIKLKDLTLSHSFVEAQSSADEIEFDF